MPMPNPYYPEYGQLIDDPWGCAVAAAVIRRYHNEDDRNADLVDYPPQNGQVVAITPDGAAPYLQMFGGSTWNLISGSPDLDLDYLVNGISLETAPILDCSSTILPAKGSLYVWGVIPHTTQVDTCNFMIAAANASGSTGSKLFVTDSIPAGGSAPNSLYTADIDTQLSAGATLQSVYFPLQGLDVGTPLWVCFWIPSSWGKIPSLLGYNTSGTMAQLINVGNGNRSSSYAAATDPTVSWPTGTATGSNVMWFGFSSSV